MTDNKYDNFNNQSGNQSQDSTIGMMQPQPGMPMGQPGMYQQGNLQVQAAD